MAPIFSNIFSFGRKRPPKHDSASNENENGEPGSPVSPISVDSETFFKLQGSKPPKDPKLPKPPKAPKEPKPPKPPKAPKPPKPEKSKTKNKDKEKGNGGGGNGWIPAPGILERTSSSVVRDGHEILNHASQLLEQYGGQLGSDIGFFYGRIEECVLFLFCFQTLPSWFRNGTEGDTNGEMGANQQNNVAFYNRLRVANPMKGKLSKKRKVSPEFVHDCQVLLDDIQVLLSLLPSPSRPSLTLSPSITAGPRPSPATRCTSKRTGTAAAPTKETIILEEFEIPIPPSPSSYASTPPPTKTLRRRCRL
ncbi:hypothetical protein NMY22_g19119 [Coprinellus aureogranulatus]|nr:hypothetical protein NMY22_g19119 [Coprinellus aureogranulatus]